MLIFRLGKIWALYVVQQATHEKSLLKTSCRPQLGLFRLKTFEIAHILAFLQQETNPYMKICLIFNFEKFDLAILNKKPY